MGYSEQQEKVDNNHLEYCSSLQTYYVVMYTLAQRQIAHAQFHNQNVRHWKYVWQKSVWNCHVCRVLISGVVKFSCHISLTETQKIWTQSQRDHLCGTVYNYSQLQGHWGFWFQVDGHLVGRQRRDKVRDDSYPMRQSSIRPQTVSLESLGVWLLPGRVLVSVGHSSLGHWSGREWRELEYSRIGLSRRREERGEREGGRKGRRAAGGWKKERGMEGGRERSREEGGRERERDGRREGEKEGGREGGRRYRYKLTEKE